MTQRTWSRRRPTAPEIHAELSTIVERRSSTARHDDAAPAPLIRALEPADRSPITDMAARCSDETLRRRFHAPVRHLNLDRVADLLTAPGAVGVVVAEVDGAVVGVGTLHRDTHGEGEMAVLVEDAWQSSGLGSRLTAELFDLARRTGVPTIVADVLREPRFLVDQLRRHNPAATVTLDGPVATIRMPVIAA